MAGDQQNHQIVDNLDVREIYVNKTIGTSFLGGTVIVTLGCMRVLPERLDTPPGQPPAVHVTGRIALTQAAAVELANALNGILAEIAKQSDRPPFAPTKPN